MPMTQLIFNRRPSIRSEQRLRLLRYLANQVAPKDPSDPSMEYDTVPAKREITIIDLLSHTSGISYRFCGKPVAAVYEQAGIQVGEYMWAGIFNTRFWIDPKEKLAIVFLGQRVPRVPEIEAKVHGAVYQAIER